ncbi:hypothetical protein [Hydrogenimonas sp.]|uniref:hypothetical protein n=1 Tax=Hydrogenimonas sp. TaxID=2231112 RepID=UPI00262480DA|nr:hypothetical protein [Hydrogenimonas sp.]
MESGEFFSLWLILLVFCELFESWWQHAPTLKGVLERVRYYYRTHIFLLFAMHPSFWLVLFIFVASGFRGTLLSLILVMKATDIAFKLWMVQKLDEGTLSPDFRAMLQMPLSAWMPWINVIIYPAMLAFALHH